MQRLNVEYIRSDERGSLIQISSGKWEQINYLILNKNKVLGGHYHKHKTELFCVIKGIVNVAIYKTNKPSEIFDMKPYDCVLVEPYESHYFTGIEDSLIIELLSKPYSKDDIWLK